MVREIHIVNQKFASSQLFYDGQVNDKHRHEYDNIDSLLKAMPKRLKNFNPKKSIVIYLEGYTDSQSRAISLFLKKLYSKSEFKIVEGIKELHFVHMPNSGPNMEKYFVYEGSIDLGNEHNYKTIDELFYNLPQRLKNTSVSDRVCVSTHDFSREDESKLKNKLNSLFSKVYYNCWKNIKNSE